MAATKIDATLKVAIKPFQTPNFARRVGYDDTSEVSAIPLRELNDDALEDLVLAWVREVYEKAGRRHCPFYEPVKGAP